MVSIVQGGTDTFNAFAYGQPNESMYSFIADNAARVSRNLTDTAMQWMDNAKQVYRQVTHSEAIRRVKAATRRVDTMMNHRHGVAPLTSITSIQNANPDMQRWIMAEPTVRKAYHRRS